jgi:hypothetical protein
MIVIGLVAGITLWWVSRYDGDAFFHLARVQKLLASLDSRCARSTSSRTAACTRATHSRSGTRLWR